MRSRGTIRRVPMRGERDLSADAPAPRLRRALTTRDATMVKLLAIAALIVFGLTAPPPLA